MKNITYCPVEFPIDTVSPELHLMLTFNVPLLYHVKMNQYNHM